MKFRMKKLLAMLMAAMMIFSNMGSAFAGTFGAENQAHTEITPRNAGSGQTVNIQIADGVSWTGHLYVVLQQKNAQTQFGESDQYYYAEIVTSGQKIDVSSQTFKAKANGGIDNQYDPNKGITASVVMNSWNPGNEITYNHVFNGGVQSFTGITPITIVESSTGTSITDPTSQNITIKIGEVVPTPHMVTITGLDDEDTFEQYRVVAKVGETTYHGEVDASVSFDGTGSNTIPDEADEDSVKIVTYGLGEYGDNPVASIITTDGTKEYYISGPVLKYSILLCHQLL